MEHAHGNPHDIQAEGRRLVSRIYRMRQLGLGLGCLAVGAVLWQRGAGAAAWAALAFTAFVWPTLGWWRARRAPDPERAERHNLMFDSLQGGVWVALMHFNLVPSALIVAMLSADKVGVGGWPLLARCAALQVLACAITAAALGFPFAPRSDTTVVLFCLPFLFAYPIGMSWTAYLLARKVVRQNRQLERMSRTDSLTGLANRGRWEEMARLEFLRARRTGRAAALLLFDVDDFKSINDRYGHPVGDAVLQAIGLRMRDTLRAIDTSGRFGGDEFGAVLVEVNPPDVRVPAERLRAAIEAMHLPEAPELRVTVSIGAALYAREFTDVADWVRATDAALYAAKRAGRNRVHVHVPEAAPDPVGGTPAPAG